MCLFNKPKVATPVTTTSPDKPLAILTNQRLNGRNATSMSRRGFQGLTIRRRGSTNPASPATPVVPTAPQIPTTPTSPVMGVGGGGSVRPNPRDRWLDPQQLLQ